MKASTISFDELLENTSVTKDAFLLGMQPFCKTPILFYFALRQKFEETIKKELIFHPNRADTLTKNHTGVSPLCTLRWANCFVIYFM